MVVAMEIAVEISITTTTTFLRRHHADASMGNINTPHGWEFIDAGGDEKPVWDIKFVCPNLCT